MSKTDSEQLDEIERKIRNNEYNIDDSDSDGVLIKDEPQKNPDDLFFATEIETEYKRPVVSRSLAGGLEKLRELRE